MTKLFSELVTAGLIGNLNGSDERHVKMEQAATTLAQSFAKAPKELMRAVLAGLDPYVREDDPALRKAEEALLGQWKTMRSVHPDAPVQLERAILLEACAQAAESEGNDVIVWLTSADTLSQMRLGREEKAVRVWLSEVATRVERRVLPHPITSDVAASVPVVDTSRAETVLPKVHVVDRARLQTLISAAVGPTDAKGRPIPDAPNPHVMAPHNMQWQAWTIEFTKRLHPLLADELDAVSTAANAGHQHLAKQVNSNLTAFAKTMQKTLAAQQNWAQEVIAQAEMQRCVDQVRLDALWWSEALYSSSVRCGYRELPPLLAVMVMAVDLVTTVTAPAPTSVGYLLMEAVRRIGDHAPPLAAVLSALRDARNKLPTGWCDPLEAPPSSGHLCLRDLFVLAVGDREWSPEAALQRAGLAPDAVITLPQLAHAMFRQEQAVRLAARA